MLRIKNADVSLFDNHQLPLLFFNSNDTLYNNNKSIHLPVGKFSGLPVQHLHMFEIYPEINDFQMMAY